ncbi:hypothetical protein TIFTF001_003436 [Ficus carica]|uniref:Uncharacterized protein n=1 Tax=Ficus carica TaxID=3494 RepID=A0AA87ZFS2_FICCA|nr:hypothetical protein TIFTF001_003436 [Ficus carica]
MLKLVVVLMSKQRGRALTRKNCSYLNRWADPLFIGIFRGLECSGDLVRLNFECSRRVDMLEVHMHRTSNRLAPRVPMATGAGDRTCIAVGGVSKGPTEHMVSSCGGNAVRDNNTAPNLAPSKVGNRDGGRSIRFPGKRLSLVGHALVGSQVLFYPLNSPCALAQPDHREMRFRRRMNYKINTIQIPCK